MLLGSPRATTGETAKPVGAYFSKASARPAAGLDFR